MSREMIDSSPPTNSPTFIVAVDLGTTILRACLFDHKTCRLVKIVQRKVELVIDRNTKDGSLRVEIEPDKFYDQFIDVVQEIVSGLAPGAKCILSICCLRNTFISWDRRTLKACHRLVTWRDCRARNDCATWNRSWTVKVLNVAGRCLYAVTRRPRFRAASVFLFINAMVTHRFLVTLHENARARELQRTGELEFGCVDSWILARLTNGGLIQTEPSCVSSTGFYDPFQKNYNHFIMNLISFPTSLFLRLQPSTAEPGSRNPIAHIPDTIFKRPIALSAILADQQSAVFGAGCWRKGDVKISLGSGTFVAVNTGDRAHASLNGLYPLVGWSIGSVENCTFVVEGNDHDTSLVLLWAQSIGLFDNVQETSAIAEEVGSSGGVVFVPAFGGLQSPYDDEFACAGFLGIRPNTTKQAMLRAVLEAIAFRVAEIFQTIRREIDLPDRPLVRICGGVSANDFICQTISTLIDEPVERVEEESYTAARGVALMAGITEGLWTTDQITDFVKVARRFEPSRRDAEQVQRTFQNWQRAVSRCLRFHKQADADIL